MHSWVRHYKVNRAWSGERETRNARRIFQVANAGRVFVRPMMTASSNSRRCSSLENWIEIPYLWVWQKERFRIRRVKNFMNYSIKNWYFSTSPASRHHWQKVEVTRWKGLPRRLPKWILNPHFIRNGNCRAIRVNVVHWDWRSSDNEREWEKLSRRVKLIFAHMLFVTNPPNICTTLSYIFTSTHPTIHKCPAVLHRKAAQRKNWPKKDFSFKLFSFHFHLLAKMDRLVDCSNTKLIAWRILILHNNRNKKKLRLAWSFPISSTTRFLSPH